MPVNLGKLYKSGEFKIKGTINERYPLVCDTNIIEVRSTGLSAQDLYNRYVKINGTTVLNQGRGIGVVRLNEFGEFVDATSYDTHWSQDAINNFIKLIRLTPDGYTLIFATFDQPVPLGNANNMYMIKPTLESLGFNKLDWNYRCAWIGVCFKGGSVIAEEFKYGDYYTTHCYIKTEVPKGVIYYPFDKTLKSHNCINGGNSKLLLSFRERKIFNGIDNYVDVGALNIDFSKGFYIKFKARWDALQSWSRIIDFGNGASAYNILIANYGTSNRLDFQVYTEAGTNVIYCENAIDVGQTDEYIISVNTDKSVTIYKNMNIIATGSLNKLPENVQRNNCYIGKSNWPDSLFKGYIEYVEIYEGAYNTSYDGKYISYNIIDNGVYLQTATTNLIDTQGDNASVDWTKWSHWNIGAYWHSCSQYDDYVMGKVFKGKANDYTFLYDYYHYPVTNGAKYSFGIYLRSSVTRNATITGYMTRHYDNNTICSDSKNITLTNEWQFVEFNLVPSETTTAGIGISFGSGWNGIYIEAARPQLEQSKFSSSYTYNQRSGTDTLSIKFNKSSNFTIFYKYSPNEKWATYFPETSYMNKAKWYLYDGNTNKKIWWYEYVNGNANSTKSDPWLGFDEYVSHTYWPWHWHFGTYNITKKKEYWFAISKNGAKWSMYYIDDDGYKKNSCTHTNQELINFAPYMMLLDGNFNYLIKDLHIYNRELTEQEILNIAKGKMSIKSTGNIVTSRIIEKPNSLPNDIHYFPLSHDTYDITKTYSASEAANLIHKDGSVYVGQYIQNILPNNSFEIDNNGDGVPDNYEIRNVNSSSCSCRIFNEGIDGKKCVVIYKSDWTTQSDDKYSYLLYHINVNANTTYTLSCNYKLFLNSTLDNAPRTVGFVIYCHDSYGNILQSHIKWTFEESHEWKEKHFSFTTPANTSYIKIEFRMSCNGYWFIDNVSLRQAPFLLPYDISGDSSLEFNLNSSLALDWSGDWSLVYFKKPVGTHSGDLNGYNLESLGCNGNSVGGKYIWWGKEIGINGISTYGDIGTKTNFSCTFSDINTQYFNQWSMVSVVKSGTTVTIKEWLKNGVFTATYTNCSIPSNGFVTQYGYDLKLGGWDNGNPVNSYYRDLIVAKRALSDNELNNIYRTLIRQKNGIQIQHNILENSI